MLTKEQIFWMNGVEIIAARTVYRKFHINRYQLHILCAAMTFMALNRRKTVGFRALCEWLGVGDKWKQKAFGYITGLKELGAVHALEYQCRPGRGGNTIAISEFGGRVLDLYFQEVQRLESKRPADFKCDRVMTLGEISQQHAYNLITAGRS
jgi:hypothetical protein